MASAKIQKDQPDSKLDAMDRVDARLDFAGAILTLIIASEDDPPAFSRLNPALQIQIIDGVRTLIEDAKAAANEVVLP